jgi:hypothetical protein
MKRKIYLMFTFLMVFSVLNVFPLQLVKAEPKTIFVPDDYPTISAAVGNATDDDTVFVRNGTYNEPALQIDKSITLTGENKNGTVIIFHSNGYSRVFYFKGVRIPLPFWENILNITATNVKLSGFTIKCAGEGGTIFLTGDGLELTNNDVEWLISGSGNRMEIVNNTFRGDVWLTGSNLTIAQNAVGEIINCQGSYNIIAANTIGTVVKGEDDPYYPRFCISAGSDCIVVGNNITTGTVGGLNINGNDSLATKNNLTASIWVNGSDDTVSANAVTDGGLIVTGNNNNFYGNTVSGYNHNNQQYYFGPNMYGLYTYQSTPDLLTLGTCYADVLNGAPALNAVNNTFCQNNFVGNTQVRLWGGVSGPNFWENGGFGNFWSTYNGTDADDDGIGDTPYNLEVLNYDYQLLNDTGIQDLNPLMAPFNGTVSVKLPDWATPALSAFVPLEMLHEPKTIPPHNSNSISVGILAVALCALVAVFGLSLIYLRKRHAPG